MAKLIIGEQIKTEVLKNKFILTLNYEHGDADYRSNSALHYDLKEKEELEIILNSIDTINSKITDSREEIDDYIDEYDGVYLNDEYRENEHSLGDIIGDLWDRDCIYADCRADLYYDVVFYDEDGIKRKVDFI